MADFAKTVINLTKRGGDDREMLVSQFAVLLHIAGARKKDDRKYGVIIDALGLPKPTLSRTAKKLSDLGYIVRVNDPNDKRTCWFDLLPKGVDYVKFVRGGAEG